jgi:hypothetical protein
MSAPRTAALLVVCACATAPSAAWTPADFRALEAQESWRELLAALPQVAPSRRDAEWLGWLERAELGELAGLEAPRSAAAAEAVLSAVDEPLRQYPVLRRSKAYLARRAELGPLALAVLYATLHRSGYDDEWVPRIAAFVEKDALTPHLAQRLARDLVQKRLVARVAAPLYRLAFQRDGEAVCAEAGLAAFFLDALEAGEWGEERRPLATRCAPQLKVALQAALAKGEDRHLLKGACAALGELAEYAETLQAVAGGCPARAAAEHGSSSSFSVGGGDPR